jgi:hypothetical protein
VPDAHELPPAQAVPQVPQLELSVWVSTQAPLHAVWPVAQLVAHEPLEQTSADVQAVPQAPQLAGSAWVFTHCPLQSS